MCNVQQSCRLIRPSLLALALLAMAGAVQAGPTRHRERILLDMGWRFRREASAVVAGDAITRWRYRSIPTDPDRETLETIPAYGVETGWPEAGVGDDTFQGRPGFAWYRTTLPNRLGPGRVLHFVSVDDNSTVWVNGVRMLTHRGWNDPFDVPLDAVWRESGNNVVTLLVENISGVGGVGVTLLQTDAGDSSSGRAATDFDDSGWRSVHLPHDFVVEGTFDPSANNSHGSLPAGVGWYRKRFDLPATDRGRRLWLDFDGVYRDSVVWLNGHLLGRHRSGYTGFRYDITDVANYGGSNVLTVEADARKLEGWWYEGGGIYRHVWLNKADPLHIAPWGVGVTVHYPGENGASVEARVQLSNQSVDATACQLVTEIQDDTGRSISRAVSSTSIAGGGTPQTTPRSVSAIPGSGRLRLRRSIAS